MLKKSMIVQVILLLAVSALGTILTTNNTQGVQMIHGGLGLITGINSLIVTYLAYTTRASQSVLGLAASGVILTFLAGVGGKLAEVNYANGLLLMRASATLALIVTAVALYQLTRKKA